MKKIDNRWSGKNNREALTGARVKGWFSKDRMASKIQESASILNFLFNLFCGVFLISEFYLKKTWGS